MTCTAKLDAPRSAGTVTVTHGLTDTAKRWISFHFNAREHTELGDPPKINGVTYEIFTVTTIEDSRYGPWYPETIHLLRTLSGPSRRDLSDSTRATLTTWATTTATRLAETLDFDTAYQTQQGAEHENRSSQVNALQHALDVASSYEQLTANPVTLRPLPEPIPVTYECVELRSHRHLTSRRRGTAHATVLNDNGHELGYAVDDPNGHRSSGPVLVPGEQIHAA